MADKLLHSPETLRQLLRYEPETGKLFWIARDSRWFKTDGWRDAWNTRWAKAEAFSSISNNGYRVGHVLSEKYQAHQVAWVIYYGEWPNIIDHIDGDKLNNKIDNLRNVDAATNHRNRVISKVNISGAAGVGWVHKAGKWVARIRENGKTTTLGAFVDYEDAVAARKAAEIRLGYHANHGRKDNGMRLNMGMNLNRPDEIARLFCVAYDDLSRGHAEISFDRNGMDEKLIAAVCGVVMREVIDQRRQVEAALMREIKANEGCDAPCAAVVDGSCRCRSRYKAALAVAA